MNAKSLSKELARLHGDAVALAAHVFDDPRYGDINDELQTAVLHLTTAVSYARAALKAVDA